MVSWSIFKDSDDIWNQQLAKMPFFTIYQTSQWGSVKKNDGWEVIRAIGKNESNETVSIGQFLFKRLPMNMIFFWCPGGILGEFQTFNLKVLKDELKYSNCYCRVSFHDAGLTKDQIEKAGWKESTVSIGGNMSMLLDLRAGAETLLKNLSSNWRHNVKRFGKKNLVLEQWHNPDAEVLYDYYKTFEAFKGLSKQHTKEAIEGVISIFKDKLVVYRSFDEEGNLLSLRGYIYEGKRCLDWFAISTEKGRSAYASYGTCWRIVEDAVERGIEYYDFSGVDPVNNTGVYNFKKGTGAELVTFPGEFERSSFFLLNPLFNFLIKKKFKNA